MCEAIPGAKIPTPSHNERKHDPEVTHGPRGEPALDALKVERSWYFAEKATGGASVDKRKKQSITLMGCTRPVEQSSVRTRSIAGDRAECDLACLMIG